MEVATTLDTTDIGGPSSLAVTSGISDEKQLYLANNVALRGCTVLSGRLVGVIMATGGGCRSSLPKPHTKLYNTFRFSRSVDRKKVLRLCEQLESVGLAVQQTDSITPLCNTKTMYIVLSVTAKHIPHLNTLLPQVCSLFYHQERREQASKQASKQTNKQTKS